MNVFIITGASKGLGEATAQLLLKENNELILIARNENEELVRHAKEAGVSLRFLNEDLSNHNKIPGMVKSIIGSINKEKAESVFFINNAGMVDPIKPAGKSDPELMTKSIHLNLLTPMLITNEFLKLTGDWDCKKVIVNISSGAANRPIYGWNTYGTTKAGVDMFTKSVGHEQGTATNPATIISFSPGIMDTDMQGTIRQADKEDFTNVEVFKNYHEKGELRSPGFVAQKMLDLIRSDGMENGRVYDIKEFV
ncbi:benzil reductase ((S)-benzoin forming) [Bacillus tianshenii]|uniref:Benzil reductase ((S)-benzoin forming) n=1 Tax=Sutcliffiella tianshenii TaxID=1463404 RepID=A0ABS2NUC2_9BACI|nr:(S)-benzoin forming benzil reductase [Bacillus tianshenii]MBM7618187.1 benzil reductase ((S)-benzoin forming) [Bacillus tianshenii]